MTWFWVILIITAIGGLIGFFSSDKNRAENAVGGALVGGLGCGYLIFQIFLAIVGIWILLAIGGWLFG